MKNVNRIMTDKLKSPRQLFQIIQPMKDVIERISVLPYFFCFDYQNDWRIITWSKGEEQKNVSLNSNLLDNKNKTNDISPQMPFCSGWVGAIQYDSAPNEFQTHYCSCSLGYHYPSKTWHFYGSKEEEEELNYLLSAPLSPAPKTPQPPVESSMSREEYIANVEKIREEIAQGNVYQINLSYRIGPFAITTPASLWHDLVTQNPSRHAFYWQTPSETIICNSPELFFRHQAGLIESAPIKGTNPNINHAQNHIDLWTSPKEEAELTMIVDMMRNDFGRICQSGSIFVEGRKIRRCGDLLHAEQRIIGRTAQKTDDYDILNACFPAASVTGTPKIAALKLINDLEKMDRRWYTGSLGFISEQNGYSEWNVCIRCIIVQGNKGYIHVGAGIVYDSNPEQEWLETQAKAKAIQKLLLTCQNISQDRHF